MRLVAVTRILDEIDIVEAFVRHTATYADHHILLDNGSRDGTREVLSALVREGLPITVIANPSVSFAEAEANTWLFREAARQHGAHWVAFLDTDEFIDDRGLADGLDRLLREVAETRPLIGQLKVRLTDYVAIAADDSGQDIVPVRIGWRGEPTGNLKSLVRVGDATRGVEIRAGGHGALWPATGYELWADPVAEGLTLAHYPERSTWQWMSKFVKGWAKVLAAGPDSVASGHSLHYRPAFETLRDRPEAILFNDALMTFKNERPGLVHDPIAYRGGALAYTPPIDERLRAVRSLLAFVEDLAVRHGALLAQSGEARRLSETWDRERTTL